MTSTLYVKCPCHVKHPCQQFVHRHLVWAPALVTLEAAMNVNFAERAHNHNWKLDPIVRSLLDTDFYKLLMLQFIWKNFPATPRHQRSHNRTVRVRLADRVSAVRPARADGARPQPPLPANPSSSGSPATPSTASRQIFEPAFLDWLEHDFRLSDYEISEDDGQLILRFSGLWTEVTMWEVYALAIVSEMKTRYALAGLTELELDILYARAKTRLWDKIENLRPIEGLRLSDFGTRRRHSFLWQEYAVEALQSALGDSASPAPPTPRSPTSTTSKPSAPTPTSSPWPWPPSPRAAPTKTFAPRNTRCSSSGSKATAASSSSCSPTPSAPRSSSQGAPDWVARWTGERVDSKDPFVAGDEYIAWLMQRGQDPRKKRLIASDGLDVDDIVRLHDYFDGRIRFSAGWGTLLTNDFRDCHPRGEDTFAPISLVCKLTSADGIPTVKLSDNPRKATGPADQIARYRRVFGSPVLAEEPVLV